MVWLDTIALISPANHGDFLFAAKSAIGVLAWSSLTSRLASHTGGIVIGPVPLMLVAQPNDTKLREAQTYPFIYDAYARLHDVGKACALDQFTFLAQWIA